MNQATSPRQLIVIDSRVNDSQSLINSINIDAAVLILDPLRDGLEQIASALNGYAELDAIQIISHGSPGSLQLGVSNLNNSNLSQYSNQLSRIGSALKKDGDILLYGCDIAQGENGTDFITQLANLTGTDVAASIDLTGSFAQRGNWVLEKQTGAIETSVIQPDGFTGVLEVNSAPSFITQGTGIVTDKSMGVIGGSSAFQLDNKIFVLVDSGFNFFNLERYNLDGSLDVNKSNDHIKQYSFQEGDNQQTIINQGDGNILVLSARYDFYVANFKQDGSLENVLHHPYNFTAPELPPYYVAVQSNGKFLTTSFAPGLNNINGFELHRYNSDGSLDVSFGNNGTASTVFGFSSTLNYDYQSTYQNMVVQSDGKTLVAGDVGSRNFETYGKEIAVVRYNADGTLDTGFSDQGIAFISNFKLGKTQCLAVQQDGKIVVAGLTPGIAYPYISEKYGLEHNIAVCRLNSDGTLDTSFGYQGYAKIDFDNNDDYVYSLKLQEDGKILLAGSSLVLNDLDPSFSNDSNIALVRLDKNGQLDKTFSGDGRLTTSLGGTSVASSIDIQNDGKILVSGLNTSFYPNEYGRLEGDTLALVRYNEDGTLDTSFNALNTLGNTVEYSSGTSVILAPKANIRDTELDAANNYSGTSLTLARHGGANQTDHFIGSGSMSFQSNGNVALNGNDVGIYKETDGSLTISFNNNASSSSVDGVLQQIAYTNTTGLIFKKIQLDWLFSDGSDNQVGTQTTVGSSFIQQNRNDLITYTSIDMESAFNWLAPKIYVVIDYSIVTVSAGQHQLNFMGEFTVNSASRSLSGTVNDLYYYSDAVVGSPVYEFHGLNLRAGKISNYVLNHNLTGLKSYLFSGNERFTGLEGIDVFNGYAGSDELLGNGGNDKLFGGSGDDFLDGGTGADIMAGGAGNDFYLVDNVNDVVTETTKSASQIDEVQSSVSFTLKANVENLTLTGTDLIDATGNASKNLLVGNAAANTLNGAASADRMIGDLGNDTYFVDNAGDVIIETSTLDTETEQVYSTITYTLGDNLENLTLLGKKAINGTGNSLDNLIVGNKANNIINGSAGADTLTGGLGADKFVFAAVTDSGPTSLDRDVITDFNTSQKDKINLSAIDADTVAEGKQSFVLTQGGAFTGSFSNVGELFFDSIEHILYGNNDADLEADFSIQLSGVSSLTITDFML